MNYHIEQAAGIAGTAPFGSLVELARFRAAAASDAVGYVYLQDGETPSEQLSYRDLDCRARAIAATLQARCAPGDRVLLLYPPGLEFLCGFFACLYAGCPAVPAYPPRRNRHDSRLEAIAQSASPALVLTTEDIVDTCRQDAESRGDLYSLPWIATNRIAAADAQQWQPYDPAPESIALIQYTSGSTSQPKGVCVSHFNLLHNFEDMHRGCDHDRNSVMVTWLPIHHDLGLIYGALQPLYRGFPCYMMPPASFLQRPLRWLEAISRFGGTHSAAPNFAFDLCVRAIEEDEVSRLDLSSMRMVLNAAEPIRGETIDRFSAQFAPAGFSRTAISGGYGLAEATLKVSMVPAAVETPVWSFSAEALERNRVVVSEDPHDCRRLVGCGQTELDTEYCIVDPQTRLKCAPDEIGEIWVRGLTVPGGYHNLPEETEKTFNARLADSCAGPYLRTGDLGFVYRDNLFITGRLKDMIIVRGINHYPHDIELTVEKACPELRGGCGAAFAVDFDGQERLVVVHELDRSHLRTPNTDKIMMRIRETVAREHGIPVHCVVLLRTNTIAKTTSGKIQRQACRKLFLENKLSVVAALGRIGDGDHGVPGRKAGDAMESKRRRTKLLDAVALHLNMAATTIDRDEPLAHYGLDSATAIALAGEIERIFGRPCSPTVLFEYPTIADLQEHLLGETDTFDAGDFAKLRGPLPAAGSAIAVVGMACRFPGAESVEAFWNLLERGLAATGDIPQGRRHGDRHLDAEDSPELQSARRGGFLDDIDRFDAGFFGIAPREADSMDPQQRLLLEVSWEALENGGIRPSTIRGTDGGVFIGISAHDYLQLQLEDMQTISAYTGTGGAHCIAANRLSYFFDLHGPSLAIDTACSSSLVAVHQAMASLRRGECGLALAGGVNVLLNPHITVGLAKAKMMSPDGCCKVFDAEANGYVRGEGCGVVILKRLAEALADGNRILAVLRGTAVRQDGRSNGLTAPNRLAQESVIRAALRDANLPPAAIDYVEAHGTGTALGDPIEVAAIRNVYTEGRRSDNTCRIGSVKANIGHLESAAGMAGLIKTILALHHATIPGNVRLRTLNPLIELDGTPLVISPVTEPWRKSNGPRIAGVSSFGFGGTIAHTIVAEFDGARPLLEPVASWQLCVLSARSVPALRKSADRLARHIRTVSGLSLAEICSTLAHGREHFTYRQAIVARSIDELLLKLEEPSQEPAQTSVRPGFPGKVVFLFSGQGSQDEGAVGKLLHTQPVFRAAIEECDAILKKELDISISALLDKAPDSSGSGKPTHIQPLFFAIQYGLARLWRSWGISPAAVVGHSLGEYGAACIAGVMDLEDALKLVACRARLAEALPVWGAMAAVFAERSAVERLLESSGCEIAAFNGARHMVVAGSETDIDALLASLAAAGVRAARLPVSHGFHSPCVEPMLDEFEKFAHRVPFREPRIEMFSTLTGTPATKEIATSGYWRRHLRQPVQFQEAMTWALSEPGNVFVEIGASATLIGMARRFTAARDAIWIPTLRPGVDGEQSLLESLAELYSLGHWIDWEGFYRERPSYKIALPTYPFQRNRHWIARAGERRGPVRTGADHPLLGHRLRLAQADGCLVWENSLGAADVWYLKDHAVNGLVVFPGAAFTEMTAAAARAAGLFGRLDITGLEFSSPLVFAGDERLRIQTVIQKKGDALECAIYSSAVDAGPDDGWRLHMRGVIRDVEYSGRVVAITDIERSCPVTETGADFYRRWHSRGNQWGASFQGIKRLRIGEGESAAWLQATSEVAGESGPYVIHPALLDTCVQTMAAGDSGDGAFVGKSVGRLHIAGPLLGELIAFTRWTRQGSRMLVGDLTVTDSHGRPLLMAEDLAFTFLDKGSDESWQQWLYTEAWGPVELPASPGPAASGTWLVIGRPGEPAEACAARLRDLGHRIQRLADSSASPAIDPAEQVRGIVCFVPRGGDHPNPEEMVQAIVDRMTAAARTVRLTSTVPGCGNARIWFVTRGIWPVHVGGAPSPAAPLWGLCSAIAAEHSANWGGMIDIEEGTDPDRSAELLVQAITRLTRCDKVRIGKTITTPRLQTMKCPQLEDAPPIRADGAYLVTGGFGELGSAVALWLGARGARHIVLIGRSGMAKGGGLSPLQQLQDAGVQVTAVALDIGDSQAVKSWADSYERDGSVPVRGIFHAAGVVGKEAVAGITEEAALPVIKAKAGGIMALEQAFDLKSMDFVVLFSSVATILNSPFLGAYAAANAFLDSYAWHRSLAGYPVTSIDWNTFAGGGMAALAEQAGDATFSRALLPLRIEDGMQILGRLLGCPAARVAVLSMAWEHWRRAYPAQAELAYWDLVPAGVARQKHEEVNLPGREELLALPREQRQARITHGLSRLVAHTLGAVPDGLDCSTPLTALGIDSLMALEIRARLEKVYGLTLPVVAIISGPSIEGLAQSLGEFLDNKPGTPPAAERLRSGNPVGTGHFPLSFNQYSQWLLAKMAPEVSAYHVSFSARVCSRLDTEALHRCLEKLVQRHATLRTTYTVYKGEISQEVHATAAVPLFEIEAGGWTDDELFQGARKAYALPFDLATGPLFRGHLFNRGPADRVLLLVVHHIACDGWSLWLLLEELGQLYGAETGGAAALLPEITANYIDYTTRQRQRWANAEELAKERQFWSRQLADTPLVMELATDFPRPASERLNGASCPIHIPQPVTGRLKRMARQLNTTMYTLLMAAYQLLLHRITGQEQILVGSPTAGRTEPDTARTVGHFVNMTVIRGDLTANPSWRTFVEAMRRTIIDTLEHQDFPFHLLVEHLQPQRIPGRSPIFQVDFTYQRAHTHAELIDFMGGTGDETRIRWGETELAPFVVPQQEGQFDLSLEMAEGEHALFGFLKYNSDLFRPETIADLCRSFCTILESVCVAPEMRIGEIPLLDGQQQKTIERWARSITSPVPEFCLHQLFVAQAALIPEERAVVCDDRFLTYRQLDERSAAIALHLQELGVGPDSIVGVCLDRSPELIISILGILKAGGAYLPLDPSHPASRREAMLIDSGAAVLIGAGGPVLLAAQMRRCESEQTVSPANLAYVIYTSGSTGTPKGVMIEHRSVVNLLSGLQEAVYSRYPGRQQVSLFASTVFDASVQQIFAALCSGHTLHVLTEECRHDGTRLIEYWRQAGVTIADATPTLLGMLLDAGLAEAEELSLRHLIVGGEPLSRETVKRLRAGRTGRGIGLTNIYGPTECCVDVTAMDLDPDNIPDLTVMPIGRPMVNVQAYILDRNGLPVVPGMVGELHIGGPCVGRGYLHRDDLTAERFIANPFEPGTRLYRTGDRARFLPDGMIAFLGRLDDQVKIRGFRIEPGEIEHRLRCCPRVRDAAVVVREDLPGDLRLVAYLVMDGGPAGLEEVRGPLVAELPDYMIPARFLVLPALPFNSSGKIDRGALPAPSAGPVAAGASSAKPRTGFEREVAAIWKEIVGLQEVGIHDNFFDLGGNSLHLARVQIRLQALLGRPVPMTALFRFPTIYALAEFCATDEHQTPASEGEDGGSRRQRGRAAGLAGVRRSIRKTIAGEEQ